MDNQNDELMHYGVLGMKWGKRKLSYMQNRADRAKSEAQTARKLAKSYVDSMDKKAEKRAAQAEINPSRTKTDRADRAKSDVQSARKLAKSYVDSMDKKAYKRAAQVEQYKKKLDTKAKKQAAKDAIKKENYEKLVKDNDRRVELYGKEGVKGRAVLGIASTAYAGKVTTGIIKDIGKSAMSKIAENPNMSNGMLHATGILTVAGMGAVTVASLRKMNQYGKDIQLANDYEYRQYVKKQNKKKNK